MYTYKMCRSIPQASKEDIQKVQLRYMYTIYGMWETPTYTFRLKQMSIGHRNDSLTTCSWQWLPQPS